MLSIVKSEPEEITVLPRSSCEPAPRVKTEAEVEEVPLGEQRKTAVEVVISLVEMAEVKLRWQAQVDSKVKVPGKVKGVKGKKCAGDIPSLSLDTVNARLDKLGPISERNFRVTLDDNIKYTAVPRAFLSNHWGGSTQATYPEIRRALIEKHGLNDFMYPNTVYNPNCPLVPGYAGLMYNPDGLDNPPYPESDVNAHRTITRDKYEPLWTYMGQYIHVWSPSLTKSEWLDQSSTVRNIWAKEIWRKGWGLTVRVRVTLRKQLGRDPFHAEFKACLDSGDGYRDITPGDIRAAYDRGEELLGVSILKCVGYDEAFQREIHAEFPNWVPPPPRPKGKNRKKTKAKAGRKRKRDETDDSDGDAEERLVFTPGTRTSKRRQRH